MSPDARSAPLPVGAVTDDLGPIDELVPLIFDDRSIHLFDGRVVEEGRNGA